MAVLTFASPTHVVTMLRRPAHPPTWATFQVPLRFNKFDIRDYLWNLYRVESVRVRSWVKHSPLERIGGRVSRPPMTKIMTVEMTQPFVWPAEPEDKEPWHNKMFRARQKAQDTQRSQQIESQRGILPVPSKVAEGTAARKSLRKAAAALLKGEKEWTTDAKLDSKWASK